MVKISFFSYIKRIVILSLVITSLTLSAQDSTYKIGFICGSILNDTSNENKLKMNMVLIEKIKSDLSSSNQRITAIGDTLLLYEMINKERNLQIITWALEFENNWEYFGFIKSYNQQKKQYEIWELVPTDFIKSTQLPGKNTYENWPAAVYLKFIETEYNKKRYYTMIGWIANESQTAYKILEVITIEKNGKPYFGKNEYFSLNKEYRSRILFSYNSQVRFQLDYGDYSYSERKWNSKKKRYDEKIIYDEFIAFDHLIPMYPDLKNRPEFMVPSGNIINAFKFEKGKWRLKEDIDARNLKMIEKKREKPQLNLLPDN